jgi:aminoglycoside phosphotransferase (APT) family kinase protein
MGEQAAGATSTFSSTSTRTVLEQAATAIGLDPNGAELLRLGENAIYRLRDAPVVVRIARGPEMWQDAAKEVNVAKWLAASGIPAARLWPVEQPVDVDGHPVTYWRFIDGRRGGPGDVHALGKLLRTVHDLPRPTNFKLPAQLPLLRVRPRIERAQVPEDDRRFLLDLLDKLTVATGRLKFPLPETVNHGDAHVQNLMVTRSGEVLLIDFEGFCWGHPEWDLATTATEYMTAGFWTITQYTDFVAAYGYDITEWADFSIIRQAREISMTTWLMQNVSESPNLHAEYKKRMATIREGRPTERWSAH